MSNSTRVLMYHKILPVVKDQPEYPNKASTILVEDFEKQIAYLNKNYKILSIKEFLSCLKDRNFPSKSLFLTFDDGQADFYRYAFPILKKYQIPATLFLTTGLIGSNQPFWWDELEAYLLKTKLKKFVFDGQSFDLSDKVKAFNKLALIIKDFSPSERKEILNQLKENLRVKNFNLERSALTWDEIKELAKNNISFGAHTHNHVNLARTNPDEAREEIALSRKMIEEKLGTKIEAFAYPYGGVNDFNAAHEEILKQSEFKIAFTTITGMINKNANPLRLSRIAISGGDNFLIFKAKLSGMHPFVKRIIQRIFR